MSKLRHGWIIFWGHPGSEWEVWDSNPCSLVSVYTQSFHLLPQQIVPTSSNFRRWRETSQLSALYVGNSILGTVGEKKRLIKFLPLWSDWPRQKDASLEASTSLWYGGSRWERMRPVYKWGRRERLSLFQPTVSFLGLGDLASPSILLWLSLYSSNLNIPFCLRKFNLGFCSV